MQTTGGDLEMLAGNLASIGVSGIVTIVTSIMVSVSLTWLPISQLVSFANRPRSGRTVLTSKLHAPSTNRLLLVRTRMAR